MAMKRRWYGRRWRSWVRGGPRRRDDPRNGDADMTTVDDQIACGTLVRLRRKRLSDAQNDFDWRRDPELARFDAASPLRSSFQEFLTSYTDDLRYPSPF